MHPHIRKYRAAHTKTLAFGGSQNEQTLRHDFINLINDFADERKLRLIPELRDKSNNTIPDGTLKDRYQLNCGYYEAKDPKDDLDDEIQYKLKVKGYSSENILFENSQIAVLYQEDSETMRINIAEDDKGLEQIIRKFLDFKKREIEAFTAAVQAFKESIPELTKNLRTLLQDAHENPKFAQEQNSFLAQCRAEINPNIAKADIDEMVIQHFLTGKLFQTVFSEIDFHRYNNIAKKIDSLSTLAFDRQMRKAFENQNAHFYAALETKAREVRDHHDKQIFLKMLYEEFYRAYNPLAADKLGVVYTPNEIVQFMLKSTDYYLQKHFRTDLAQPNVNILDPATGTGTFIADLIDYLSTAALPYKYQNEIFANEVAILPYYIAALNIEYTYHQKIGSYCEFANIAFVDTLDNHAALDKVEQSQDLNFGISAENAQRIQRQNQTKISVIIGNPPYNANQQNYSDQNANRKYEQIDQRIKNTFHKFSTAQKNDYDMYKRFYRWAMDRLDAEKGGIIAFITNNSFLNAIRYDGFRKCVFEDFDYIYVVDLGGNIRANFGKNLKIGNVFKIQTGVCIAFFVKTKTENQRQKLFYYPLKDEQTGTEKLEFLKYAAVENIPFQTIYPDPKHNWLHQTDNDFDDLLCLCSKQTKNAKPTDTKDKLKAVFKLFCRGVGTNRDAWVYDFDRENLEQKIQFFISIYEKDRQRFYDLPDYEAFGKDDRKISKFLGTKIKYTRELITRDLLRNNQITFSNRKIIPALFRPFVKKWNYFDSEHRITHEPYQTPAIFGKYGERENRVIQFSGVGHSKPFHCLATNSLPCLDNIEKGQCLPFYRYNAAGQRIENITKWALAKFQNHYRDNSISKVQIFEYVYAVLHCPQYRQKYKFNLQRDFPRVPFYKDFQTWSQMGKRLMDLHIGFEAVAPYPLKRTDLKIGMPKLKLKADKVAGSIVLDSETSLLGVPVAAWDYILGSRSALEWVLDQYKEKKIKDKTVAEKFNTYRFLDYKEEVILLLGRVCRVSVETVKIIDSLAGLDLD